MTFVFECRECRICGVYNGRICYAYKYTDASDATIDDVKDPGSFCPYNEGKPKWKPLEREKE